MSSARPSHPATLLLRSLAAMAVFVAANAAAAGEPPAPGEVVLLDFSASWCGPCRAMAPLIEEVGQAGWQVRHVDVDREHDLVKRFGVTGVPCYVLLVHGKEVGRISGATTRNELDALLARSHGGGPSAASAAEPPPQAELPGIPLPETPAAAALAIQPPPPRRLEPPAATLAANTSARGLPAAPPAAAVAAGVPAAVPTRTAAGSGAIDRGQLEARLLAATARLRVAHGEGTSRGTGTVIDCRQGEALILTCGHIFRDCDGQGRIEVDLFGGDAPRGLAGQLVDWDLRRDVALVSVFTDAVIEPVPVAGPDRTLDVGEPVATAGCDGGGDATVHFSRITAVDKYLGPANVQVAGQPVQGRSGGGLFSLAGELIGVCNAADPADDEGLYAALATVHEQLDEAGLSFVYRQTYPSGSPPPLAASTPSMPETMPPVSFDRRDRAAAVPTASTAEPGGSLTAGEEALLDHVRQHRGRAEVICIVRPHGDPHASSEVFVLDNAATDFVDHLSQAHQAEAPATHPPAAGDHQAIASLPEEPLSRR